MIRSETILRAVLTLLFTYIVAIGAPFNGLLLPQFKTPTLILTALILVIWLFIRWRRGWAWHMTPLDGVLLLWALAFGLSLLANLDSWRRITIGLWYVGLYIVVWYILQDAIANRALKREVLVDALLITGLIVMIFAVWQVKSWLDTRLPLITAGIEPFDLPRPVSTIGNANALGTFLLVLVPFALARMLSVTDRFGRILLGLYAALAGFLVFLTFSRGAWLGLVAAVIVFVTLLLSYYQMLSVAQMKAWWQTRTRRTKGALSAFAALSLVVILVGIMLFISSFSLQGRGISRRTVLYQPAIDLFAESPLVGHGLFTFGQGYSRLVSMPPNQPHSHAHDAVLHIAAELGLVGLIALFATLAVMVFTIRRNWQQTNQKGRFLLAASSAAVTGFAVHHLLDTPAMMPAIALTGLLVLAVALAPVEPQPVKSSRSRLSMIVVSGVSLVLLVTGFWSSHIYASYVEALRYGVNSDDYRGAAEQLQPVIDSDPSLALYHLEQAYFLGLAANAGDTQAAAEAIAALDRYLELEPQNAIAWANKAALQNQLGQSQQAIESMGKAVDLAPSSWQLVFNLATYAESAGDTDIARAEYQRALNSISYMYPVWDETNLRREVSSTFEIGGLSRVVLLLESGSIDEALASWEALPKQKTPAYRVVRVLLALANDERDTAFSWLAQAHDVMKPDDSEDEAWIHLGTARVAQYEGNDSVAAAELAAARELLEPSLLDEDVIYAANIPHFQFLRLAIVRQFLPQVYYPTADPLLQHLLAGS